MNKIIRKPWAIALQILVAILLLCILGRVATGVNRSVSRETLTVAGTLLKASSRWALMAEQDKNPLIALMHIDHALAYGKALRELLNDREIHVATGVDMREHVANMERRQAKILTRIGDKCSRLRPKGGFAVSTGWI